MFLRLKVFVVLGLYWFGAINMTFFSHFCGSDFHEISVYLPKKCCEDDSKSPMCDDDTLSKSSCCNFSSVELSHSSHEIPDLIATNLGAPTLSTDVNYVFINSNNLDNNQRRCVNYGPPNHELNICVMYQVFRI